MGLVAGSIRRGGVTRRRSRLPSLVIIVRCGLQEDQEDRFRQVSPQVKRPGHSRPSLKSGSYFLLIPWSSRRACGQARSLAELARRTLLSCRLLLRSRNLLCLVWRRAGFPGRGGLGLGRFWVGRISGRSCGLGRLALRPASLGCRGQLFRSRFDPRFPELLELPEGAQGDAAGESFLR
jgi:hypothetical protein